MADTAIYVRQDLKLLGWSINPGDLVKDIFDGALDSVAKKINEVIDRTEGAAKDIIVKAGEEVARIIASAKVAYLDCLEKTYQDIDKLARENIDRIGDLVQKIITEERDALLDVADRIEDIIKFCPLSNWWLPLLSSVSPRFFAVEIDSNQKDNPTITKVLVTFKGNFAYAEQKGCTPSFTLNGQEYLPSSNTTKELKFLIDVKSDEPKLKTQRCCYIDGNLKVIWKSGYFTWTESNYKCLLGVLPTTPGKIKAIYNTAESTISKTFWGDPIVVHRSKNHWVTQQGRLLPDPGWFVLAGSGAFHWIDKHGDQINATITSYAHNVVDYEYSRKDGSGTFQIAFEENKTTPASERSQELADLRWGNTIMLESQGKEKITKIVLDSFNGEHVEFQPRTDDTNPFITLRLFDGTIQVTARRSSAIKDPY